MKIINDKINIWEEKYRPQVIEDIILPDEYLEQFKSFTKDEMLPNMLFVSSIPGTGKCLDYDEEIEVFMSEELFERLRNQYEERRNEE